MTIRLAEQDDGPKLWALAEELIASQAEFGAPDYRRAMATFLAHGVSNYEAIVVAEQDGELVGFTAWARVPDGADGEVCGMGTYVKPSWRKGGLSNRLREFAKAHCKSKGYQFVTAVVWKGNYAGLASAESSGANIVGYLVEWKL